MGNSNCSNTSNWRATWALLACVVLATASISTAATVSRTLLWSEEFNNCTSGYCSAGRVNLQKWQFMLGDGSAYGIPNWWGNAEKECYGNESAVAKVHPDGKLRITAVPNNKSSCYNGNGLPDAPPGASLYRSARLRTTQGFAYNATFPELQVEARIKVPRVNGTWPAFWMLPVDNTYGYWPTNGEVDIMEHINDADRFYGTLHYGSLGDHQANGNSIAANATLFHVFTLKWSAGRITWAIDGTVYHSVTVDQWQPYQKYITTGASYTASAPFDQKFYILLNLAVGGYWPMAYTSQLPKTAVSMQIDWVRVYGNRNVST